ncbi:MAG: hypothetical protein ACREGD_03345 [Candidatus Saccharimonadales bacterium]
MTEHAAEFYTIEAQRLGVVPPPIFNGEPKQLLSAGEVLPTSAPGEVGTRLVRDFRTVLESVIPFVITGARDASPIYYDNTVIGSNERNIGAVTGAMLLPRGVSGGRISSLAIEAIAPDELVLPGMLSAFGPSTNNLGIRQSTARRVFMIVSGLIKERAFAVKPCAGIAGVYLNTSNHTKKPTPHFVTGALAQAIARDWHAAHQ